MEQAPCLVIQKQKFGILNNSPFEERRQDLVQMYFGQHHTRGMNITMSKHLSLYKMTCGGEKRIRFTHQTLDLSNMNLANENSSKMAIYLRMTNMVIICMFNQAKKKHN